MHLIIRPVLIILKLKKMKLWTLVNCEILKRRQKNRCRCRRTALAINSDPEKIKEPCTTLLASRKALDLYQSC